jgi:hypothetical protein
VKGVIGPVLITGVVVAIGNGWILSAWTWVFMTTHTGNAPGPTAAQTFHALPVAQQKVDQSKGTNAPGGGGLTQNGGRAGP